MRDPIERGECLWGGLFLVDVSADCRLFLCNLCPLFLRTHIAMKKHVVANGTENQYPHPPFYSENIALANTTPPPPSDLPIAR